MVLVILFMVHASVLASYVYSRPAIFLIAGHMVHVLVLTLVFNPLHLVVDVLSPTHKLTL